MTTEKHDPWALLREARDQLVGVQGMGKATQTIARIDAALAEHDTPVVESEVPWENSQQVTFLNGFRIQVYPSRLDLGWWEFLVERDPRDPNERLIGQGTSKQAAMRGGIQAVKEWK